MADLQTNKIQVFANINDQPSVPTANKAGNGSHLISKFNSLIDELETEITSLQNSLNNSTVSKWIIANGEYTSNIGDKIIFEDNTEIVQTEVLLHLPNNPQVGDAIELFKIAANYQINIVNYFRFNGNNYYSKVFVSQQFEAIELIYCGNDRGWYPNRQNIIEYEVSST